MTLAARRYMHATYLARFLFEWPDDDVLPPGDASQIDSILGFYMFWATFDRWKTDFNHGLIKGKGLMVELCGDTRKMNDFWYELVLGLSN